MHLCQHNWVSFQPDKKWLFLLQCVCFPWVRNCDLYIHLFISVMLLYSWTGMSVNPEERLKNPTDHYCITHSRFLSQIFILHLCSHWVRWSLYWRTHLSFAAFLNEQVAEQQIICRECGLFPAKWCTCGGAGNSRGAYVTQATPWSHYDHAGSSWESSPGYPTAAERCETLRALFW